MTDSFQLDEQNVRDVLVSIPEIVTVVDRVTHGICPACRERLSDQGRDDGGQE